MRTAGIHHITAIAGDPARHLVFYTEVLGLRLVKRTVNFDDPGSYHLYFGDNIGTPGTIITFFLWPGARRGVRGSGQVVGMSFAVPRDSFEFWKERLRENDVNAEEIESVFEERRLRFIDPDGLLLELVIPSEVEGSRGESLKVASRNPSTSVAVATFRRHDGGVPPEHQIRGFAAPRLQIASIDLTEKLLIEILGFRFVAEEGRHRRLRGSEASAASRIDLLSSERPMGHIAVGRVHHIAFRAADKIDQLRWREKLIEGGFAVSPVMDRKYFRSIYFREPNGILFEIATDGPGFIIDETPEALGQTLKLPAAFEPMRAEIERVLPPLESVAALS